MSNKPEVIAPADMPEVIAPLTADIQDVLDRAEARFGIDKDKKPKYAPFHRRCKEYSRLTRVLSGYGATAEEIANVIGVTVQTLIKFYADDLKEGRGIAKAKIKKKIFDMCMEGNTEMLKMYAKTQLGWKETRAVENHITVSNLTKEQHDAMVRAKQMEALPE